MVKPMPAIQSARPIKLGLSPLNCPCLTPLMLMKYSAIRDLPVCWSRTRQNTSKLQLGRGLGKLPEQPPIELAAGPSEPGRHKHGRPRRRYDRSNRQRERVDPCGEFRERRTD